MSWFHCGKGDYEQVTISDESNSRTVSHIVTQILSMVMVRQKLSQKLMILVAK